MEIDLRQEQPLVGQAAAELHTKVSLLAGGNLAYVAADAVVNAANRWLTTGKGERDKHRVCWSLKLAVLRCQWNSSCSRWSPAPGRVCSAGRL